MKITERRLRSIIRSVIKEEQRLDEAMDMMYAGTPYEAGPSGTLKDILDQPLPRDKELMLDEIKEVLELCGFKNRQEAFHALGFWSAVLGLASGGYGAMGKFAGASAAANLPFFMGAGISLGVFMATILYEVMYGDINTLKGELDGRSEASFQKMIDHISPHVNERTVEKLRKEYNRINK